MANEQQNNNWGDVTIVNNRIVISDASGSKNVVSRPSQNLLIEQSELYETIDDTIYELIPTPPVQPNKPPIDGQVRVANWSKIIEFGGSTDPEIDVGGDWVPRYAHEYPARYALNLVYRFYTGDGPLFYVHNPVSYVDAVTGLDVLVDKIVWKIDGEEVSNGIYLQMYNVEPTQGRKALTVELHNDAGVKTMTTYYEIANSEEDNEVQGFSSEYEGFYTYDPVLKKAVFGDDPRYTPRWIKFEVHYNNTYNGENKKGKFKDWKNPIRVDGNVVQLYDASKNPYPNEGRDLSAYDLESNIGDSGLYILYPPGPLTIEITCEFDYRSWGKYRRKFYKKYETNIDPDSSITDDINLGVINVGKTDHER